MATASTSSSSSSTVSPELAAALNESDVELTRRVDRVQTHFHNLNRLRPEALHTLFRDVERASSVGSLVEALAQSNDELSRCGVQAKFMLDVDEGIEKHPSPDVAADFADVVVTSEVTEGTVSYSYGAQTTNKGQVELSLDGKVPHVFGGLTSAQGQLRAETDSSASGSLRLHDPRFLRSPLWHASVGVHKSKQQVQKMVEEKKSGLSAVVGSNDQRLKLSLVHEPKRQLLPRAGCSTAVHSLAQVSSKTALRCSMQTAPLKSSWDAGHNSSLVWELAGLTGTARHFLCEAGHEHTLSFAGGLVRMSAEARVGAIRPFGSAPVFLTDRLFVGGSTGPWAVHGVHNGRLGECSQRPVASPSSSIGVESFMVPVTHDYLGANFAGKASARVGVDTSKVIKMPSFAFAFVEGAVASASLPSTAQLRAGENLTTSVAAGVGMTLPIMPGSGFQLSCSWKIDGNVPAHAQGRWQLGVRGSFQ